MTVARGTTNQQSNPGALHPVVEEVLQFSYSAAAIHNLTLPQIVNAGDLLIFFSTLASKSLMDISSNYSWDKVYDNDDSNGARSSCYRLKALGTEAGTTVSIVVDDGTTKCAAQLFRITSWSGQLLDIDSENEPHVLNSGSLEAGFGSYPALWINVFHGAISGTLASHPSNYSDLVVTATGASTQDARLYSCRLLNFSLSEDPNSWIFNNISGSYLTGSVVVKGGLAA